MNHALLSGTYQASANKVANAHWRSNTTARSTPSGHCQHCLAPISLRARQSQKHSRIAVAAVEDTATSDGEIDDLEEESPAADTGATDGASEDASRYADKSEYKLNFLWMDKNIGVAVDQVFAKNMRSPVTEYYFWPRKDAWEELKIGIEAKPWIGYRDKVTMLNTTTEVINFWQTEGKRPTADEAREKFPDCFFRGQ